MIPPYHQRLNPNPSDTENELRAMYSSFVQRGLLGAEVMDVVRVTQEASRWDLANQVISERAISFAEEQAVNEALIDLPKLREEQKIKKILRTKKSRSLKPIKEKLQMARKPKMRTVEQYLCDECDHVIALPADGFVIQGNIYTADPSSQGGLIGNNFPEVSAGEKIDVDMIKKTVLCTNCFLRALNVSVLQNQYLLEGIDNMLASEEEESPSRPSRRSSRSPRGYRRRASDDEMSGGPPFESMVRGRGNVTESSTDVAEGNAENDISYASHPYYSGYEGDNVNPASLEGRRGGA